MDQLLVIPYRDAYYLRSKASRDEIGQSEHNLNDHVV